MTRRLTPIVFGLAVSVGCSSGGGSGQPGDRAAGQPASAVTDVQRAAGGTATTTGVAERSSAVAAPEPPKPQVREVTVPAGTAFNVVLETAVSSDQSNVEDPVRAALTKSIVINGTTVVPEGATLIGAVLEAHQSGRVKGRASVAFRFTQLHVGNETQAIRTPQISREAEPTKSDDAKKIGIGAGAGALIGAVAGGNKGAAIGGVVGAGAGTGAVLATRGNEVRLRAGTRIKTVLEAPIKIMVPID
jgi:hypothetical protein